MQLLHNFNYQMQEGEKWCSVACLSMIFDYYNKTEKQREIITDILNDDLEKIIITYKQEVKKAFKNGLYACHFRITEPYKMLDWCEKNKIILKIHHRIDSDGFEWHGVIYNGKDDEFIYVTDPINNEDSDEKGIKKYRINEFINLCKWNGNIKGIDKEFYNGTVFSDKPDLFLKINCNHCDIEYYIPDIELNEDETNYACPYCTDINKANFAVGFGTGFIEDNKHFEILFESIYNKIIEFRNKLKKHNITFPLVNFKTNKNLPQDEVVFSVDNRISFRKVLNGCPNEYIVNEIINAFKAEFNFNDEDDTDEIINKET